MSQKNHLIYPILENEASIEFQIVSKNNILSKHAVRFTVKFNEERDGDRYKSTIFLNNLHLKIEKNKNSFLIHIVPKVDLEPKLIKQRSLISNPSFFLPLAYSCNVSMAIMGKRQVDQYMAAVSEALKTFIKETIMNN
ncbi:hypothetical protein [Falsibacillus albus]|uniref:Uncharacterized protein n=1 Tax=Falsibacillus albus TaxID=2478915 RepID=A0A3L7JZ64_9BACI|nr:hypothetical protein [Falsibacillus albus]RLQ95419.1 hypothetical protein D9X91_10305 [Falsibacillus albus]